MTAIFLLNSDELTSERYHDAWILRCWASAQQYERFKDDLNLQDLPDNEIVLLDNLRKTILAKYSDDISKDWAWARSGLQLATEKSRVTFSDIEVNVCMDHWRPYTQLAHQEIHAGFVRPDKGLGVSESQSFIHLVGPSNSGMCDPGQNLAITLAKITETILKPISTIDSIAYTKSIRDLSEKVLPLLKIGEQRKSNA